MSTPYLGLDLPVVTVTLGPEWATLLNAALSVIDNHDHTSGRGRLITSAALNINDDVSINGYNLTGARSFQMQNLGSTSDIQDPTDVRCVYSVNGELYYTDNIGNQIQLTAGGALNAASVGGIGGDYATSSANVFYTSTSKTFTFNQNTDQRAKLDIGDLIIRETVASANGVTIKSASGLAASYAITLPAALPASTLALQISNTGVITPALITDAQLATDSVIEAKIQNGAVTTDKISNDNVTQDKLAATAINDSIQISSTLTGSGNFIVPAGVTRIWGTVVGGGGGGGGGGIGQSGTGNAGCGGGGGGGGQQLDFTLAVTAGDLIPYACGAGGSGGSSTVNGSVGSGTLFGRFKAAGGSGGGGGGTSNGNGGTVGQGASGSANGGGGGNTLTAGFSSEAVEGSGTAGAAGDPNGFADDGGGGGGAGAPSIFGNGGNGGKGMNGGENFYRTPPTVGANGGGGGGGGGGRSLSTQAGETGAAGGAGAIKIYYFAS